MADKQQKQEELSVHLGSSITEMSQQLQPSKSFRV